MKPFDVAISFAGEDRGIANQLAQLLKASGLLIFYDDDERSQLLGENLFEYLIEIYKNQASYCVILVSKDYVKKRWPRHDFHAVQARVFEQFDQAYMLPIRSTMPIYQDYFLQSGTYLSNQCRSKKLQLSSARKLRAPLASTLSLDPRTWPFVRAMIPFAKGFLRFWHRP